MKGQPPISVTGHWRILSYVEHWIFTVTVWCHPFRHFGEKKEGWMKKYQVWKISTEIITYIIVHNQLFNTFYIVFWISIIKKFIKIILIFKRSFLGWFSYILLYYILGKKLELHGTKKEDRGIYSCVAKNQVIQKRSHLSFSREKKILEKTGIVQSVWKILFFFIFASIDM